MHKAVGYMIVLLLLMSSPSRAQEVEDEFDTLPEVMVVPAEEQEGIYGFDQIDTAQLNLNQIKIERSVLDSLRKDDAFWYANQKPVVKKEVADTLPWYIRLAQQPWFKTLMWSIVILSFIVILIIFLAKSNVSLFRKEARRLAEEPEAEEHGENIFDIRYEKEIARAINAGDLHLAIRLYYLQTLKEMSAKGLIQYRQERTNGDYLFQLFNSPYYKDFFGLTRNYEYVWYGKFPVTQPAFESMQKAFGDFKRRLGQ